MSHRKTRAMPRNVVTLILLAVMALGLVACGDAGSPIASSSPPTLAQNTPATTTQLDEPAQVVRDGWTTFTSEADDFSVDMPGEPETSTRSMDSAVGELTFHFFQLTKGSAFYAVSYNDYPAEMTAEDLDTDNVLENGLEATAQGSEAQNVQRIEVDGNPGVEGEATVQETNHVWYKGILVKNRFYQLVVVAPEADKGEFGSEARRFTESFKLLNR
jgi:hypothetical protein